jgi:hypothetical protein
MTSVNNIDSTTNIINNGTFGDIVLPSIYFFNVTPSQQSLFGWSSTLNFVVLSNKIPTSIYAITRPDNVNNSFVSLSFINSLSQIINIQNSGKYTLSFIYCRRPPIWPFNPIDIYLNEQLLDTITTSSTSWSLFTKTFYISKSDNLRLSFNTTINKYNVINITNVSLIYNVEIPLPPLNILQLTTTNVKPNNKTFIDRQTTDDNQVIKQIFNRTARTNVLETYYIKNYKKYIGGTKNTDSSSFTKNKKTNAVGFSRI